MSQLLPAYIYNFSVAKQEALLSTDVIVQQRLTRPAAVLASVFYMHGLEIQLCINMVYMGLYYFMLIFQKCAANLRSRLLKEQKWLFRIGLFFQTCLIVTLATINIMVWLLCTQTPWWSIIYYFYRSSVCVGLMCVGMRFLCLCSLGVWVLPALICRVGQNRIYTPYMTV